MPIDPNAAAEPVLQDDLLAEDSQLEAAAPDDAEVEPEEGGEPEAPIVEVPAPALVVEAPAPDPAAVALDEAIKANPAVQARIQYADALAKAGDIAGADKVIDEVSVMLGAAAPKAVEAAPAVEVDEESGDVKLREIEIINYQSEQQSMREYQTSLGKANRLASTYSEVAETLGKDSAAAVAIAQQWGELDQAVKFHAAKVQNIQNENKYLDTVVKPNLALKSMGWAAPVKDTYAKACFQGLINPAASPAIQKQQYEQNVGQLPRIAATKQTVSPTALENLRKKMTGPLAKKGNSAGSVPRGTAAGLALAAQSWKAQVSSNAGASAKLTKAQIAEYSRNGMRHLTLN